MARSEPRRNWSFPDSTFGFEHRFLNGSQFSVIDHRFHFNPGILSALRESRPEILLVSGSWTDPTIWLASISACARRTIFWSESHLGSTTRTSFVARLARRFVLRRFREFAVPGTLAKEYVERHVPASRTFLLPNVVDPVIYKNGVDAQRHAGSQKPDGQRTLLIVARLAPEKGLLPFLESLKTLSSKERSKLRVLIVGSGPLLRELQKWIAANTLNVTLLGQQSEAELVKLYAAADGFCLPSISDPNPLAVIEALWAGLPLLLSSRVGNHPECLQEAQNGFLFDPVSLKSMANAVSRWLALSPMEQGQFGDTSQQIAENYFSSDETTEHFLHDVLAESACVASERVGISANVTTERAAAASRMRS